MSCSRLKNIISFYVNLKQFFNIYVPENWTIFLEVVKKIIFSRMFKNATNETSTGLVLILKHNVKYTMNISCPSCIIRISKES